MSRPRRVVLGSLSRDSHALVGLTVMPGPQVGSAIALSTAFRALSLRRPEAEGL